MDKGIGPWPTPIKPARRPEIPRGFLKWKKNRFNAEHAEIAEGEDTRRRGAMLPGRALAIWH
jgi:hypothetical protein